MSFGSLACQPANIPTSTTQTKPSTASRFTVQTTSLRTGLLFVPGCGKPTFTDLGFTPEMSASVSR